MPTWAIVLIIVLLLLILWQVSRLRERLTPRKPAFEDQVVAAAVASFEEGVPGPGVIPANQFGQAMVETLKAHGEVQHAETIQRLMDQGRLVLPLKRFGAELAKRDMNPPKLP